MSRSTAIAVMLAAAALLTSCSDDLESSPKELAPVQLAVDGSDKSGDPVSVGVVWTADSDPGQGSDLRFGASGAEVAAYRLGLGGADVTVVAENDEGDSEVAVDKVQDLVSQGVSGIVFASTGDHLDDAIQAASDAGVPVLLPYYRYTGDATGVWVTGATSEVVAAQMDQAVVDLDDDTPAVVYADGFDAPDIDSGYEVDATEMDRSALTRRLKALASRQGIDSVVVIASSRTAAEVVAIAQGELASYDLGIVLSPEALSAPFGKYLAEAGGTVAGNIVAVGTNSGDMAALSPTRDGERIAAFLTGVRLAAGDDEVSDLSGSGALGSVASWVDTQSHDAALALVRAAEAAGSSDPAAVLAELQGMKLDASEGLAGAPLDFTADSPLAAAAVVSLRPTTQDPGLRPPQAPGPASDGHGESMSGTSVYWFSTPAPAAG